MSLADMGKCNVLKHKKSLFTIGHYMITVKIVQGRAYLKIQSDRGRTARYPRLLRHQRLRLFCPTKYWSSCGSTRRAGTKTRARVRLSTEQAVEYRKTEIDNSISHEYKKRATKLKTSSGFPPWSVPLVKMLISDGLQALSKWSANRKIYDF